MKHCLGTVPVPSLYVYYTRNRHAEFEELNIVKSLSREKLIVLFFSMRNFTPWPRFVHIISEGPSLWVRALPELGQVRDAKATHSTAPRVAPSFRGTTMFFAPPPRLPRRKIFLAPLGLQPLSRRSLPIGGSLGGGKGTTHTLTHTTHGT